MKTPWFHIVCEIDVDAKPAPMVRDIQRAVCRRFPGVRVHDLLGPYRDPEISHARQLAMYLSRKITLKSFPTLGRAFDRDYSTVMHSFRKIELQASQDSSLDATLQSISRELGCAA